MQFDKNTLRTYLLFGESENGTRFMAYQRWHTNSTAGGGFVYDQRSFSAAIDAALDKYKRGHWEGCIEIREIAPDFKETVVFCIPTKIARALEDRWYRAQYPEYYQEHH